MWSGQQDLFRGWLRTEQPGSLAGGGTLQPWPIDDYRETLLNKVNTDSYIGSKNLLMKECDKNIVLVSEEEHDAEAEAEAEDEEMEPQKKVGAKKQRKLEEKQAKKAQREVRTGVCGMFLSITVKGEVCVYSLAVFLSFQAELEEREERRRMQELRDQERQQEDERERLQEQKQVTISPNMLLSHHLGASA